MSGKLFRVMSLALVAIGLIALTAPLAFAQAAADAVAPGGAGYVRQPSDQIIQSSGKGMALVFWAFALTTIGGSLFVITRRNLIAAVMGMVGTFLGIAAVYMMLYAHFLSVVQVLVYAGAIMVLFVFVIMILNKPEDEPFAVVGRAGKGLAMAAMGYLLFRVVMVVWKVTPPDALKAAAAPGAVLLPTAPGAAPDVAAWGSTKAVGLELFTGYLFPFEAVSILLLVAVVGAIAIARPLAEHEGEAGPETDSDAEPDAGHGQGGH